MRHLFLIALTCGILVACTARIQKNPPPSVASSDRQGAAAAPLTGSPGSTATLIGGPVPAATRVTASTGERASTANADGCEAGCSLENHPVEHLTEDEYAELVKTFATGTGDARASALETLLFHARHVRELMATSGDLPLSADQAAFLHRELAKTHVRIWLRIVDESGIVRANLDGAPFAISQKTHLHITDTQDLTPPEVSGTVYRTGLHHLWTRI